MEQLDIVDRYNKVIFKAKIVATIVILLSAPRLLMWFSSENTFLGLGEFFWFIVSGVGAVLLIWFYKVYWKCPSCNEFPGGGWKRKSCKVCDTPLASENHA